MNDAPRPRDALRLIHEDAHLLVFDKPAGLLSVPGRGADKQDCLSARAASRWPDALVVHRLDMATSGLLIMARGPAVQRLLGDAFARREVHKRYEAIVEGHLPIDAAWASIDAPIAADWPRRPMQKIDPAGKPSQTRWLALRDEPAWRGTRLALEPLTGRSHQLRVHLASIGHPIRGDALYAPEDAALRPPRLMLHATTLELDHPVEGRRCRFLSEAPF